MKYKIKMTLEGEFPGSPDHDNFEVDEEEKIQSKGEIRGKE